MSRKKAREAVLMAFYQNDIAEVEPEQALHDALIYLEQEDKAVFNDEERAYAKELLTMVDSYLVQADQMVSSYLKEWKLERLATMDRAVLRLGTAELMGGKLPPAVVIDQAVDLAKKYGDDKSAPLVNAVLDNIKGAISS